MENALQESAALRRSLLGSLIAVFALIAVAQASNDYPPCSLSQLNALLELRPDYDALEQQMAVVETLEDFLVFRKAQLILRDRAWDMLPRCAEAIAFGDLLTRRYELFAALSANFFWWTALETQDPDSIFNPYRESFLDEKYSEQYHQLLAEIEARLADEAPLDLADGRLPTCTAQELETLYQARNEYLLLLEAFWGIDTRRDMPEYGVAQVQWSDRLRARLPACEMAFEASILMQRDLFNDAIAFTLFNAGVDKEDIPRHAAHSQTVDKIQALAKPAEDDYRLHPSTWVFDSAMVSCSTDERERLYDILQGYLEILNAARGLRNSANLIEFGQALIQWRTESWTQLPLCSEALEVGAAIRESAGDTVEFAKDDLAWLPAGAIESLEAAVTGEARLGQRLIDIDAGRFGSDYPWHRRLSDEDNRPSCASEAIDEIADMVQGFLDVLEVGKMRDSWTGGLLAYIDARIAWREDSRASVPDCRIRYDLGSMLSQDALNLFSGRLPVIGQLLNPGGDPPVAIEANGSEPGSSGGRRPYSNNLRSCASEELRRFNVDAEAYLSVIRGLPPVETMGDLVNPIERNLKWREEQWVDLLSCAETFEIGILINQIASDMLTARALDVSGVSPILNPYYRKHLRDTTELTKRTHEIADMIALREDAPPVAAESSAPPFCTHAELEILRALLNEFRKGPRMLLKGLSPQAVHSYSQFQDEWRPSVWSRIPACFEALEVGLLMTRQSGDMPTITALSEADASLEDNPYMRPGYCDFKALGTWLIILGAPDASTSDGAFSCVGLEVPQIIQ